MFMLINKCTLLILELWLLTTYGSCACPANPPAEGRILCPGAHENTTEEQCIEFAFDCCWEDTPGAVSCHLNTDTANSSVNNYYHIPNTALNDPDLSVSTAATAENCSALCDSTQFCAGTMFRNGSCALKKRITSIGEVGASDYDLYIQRHLKMTWGADNTARLHVDGVEMAYSSNYSATNVNRLPASTKSVAFELTDDGVRTWGLKVAYNTGWVTGDAGYWKCTSDSSLITSGWAEWGSYNDYLWPEAIESVYTHNYPQISDVKPIWSTPKTRTAWCRHHLMEQAQDICRLNTALCGTKATCFRDGAYSFICHEVVVTSQYEYWEDNKALLFDYNTNTCVQGGSGELRPHFLIRKVDVASTDCTVTVSGTNLTCSPKQGMYLYAGDIENEANTAGKYQGCVLSSSVADANNAALYTACTYTCAGECTAIVFNFYQNDYPNVEICEITF